MRKRTGPIRKSADEMTSAGAPLFRPVSTEGGDGGTALATQDAPTPGAPRTQTPFSRNPKGSAPATATVAPPPSPRTDLEALCALERQSFPAADAFSRAQLRYLLSSPRASFHLVRREGRVVGSAILLRRRTPRGPSGRLYSMAVSPDCRGQGLGRVLMDDVLAACRREGIARLTLEVRADNAPAVALYRKYGFRTAHELPDYYGPRQPGLKMVADL